MFMVYPVLKWIHILMAIVAIGSNATYGIWIARASRKPEALPFTLRGIKLIDDRFANPAYGMLLITGLLMAFQARPLLTAPWLQTALMLYGLLVLLGLLGYTPTLKKQIQLLESQGPASPEYQAVARRGTALGILTILLAVAIVFLMVVKPSLWA
jgi:uncharacterized membrane protein